MEENGKKEGKKGSWIKRIFEAICVIGILCGMIFILFGNLLGGLLISFVFLVVLIVIIVVVFVPEKEEWMIERFHKYNRKHEAGIHMVIPFMERVRNKVNMKEHSIDIFPGNPSIDFRGGGTAKLVSPKIWVVVTNSYNATYEIDDYKEAVKEASETTVRTRLNKLDVEQVIGGIKPEDEDGELLNDFLNEKIEAEQGNRFKGWGVEFKELTTSDYDWSEEVKNARRKRYEKKIEEAIAESIAIIQGKEIGEAIRNIKEELVKAGVPKDEAAEKAPLVYERIRGMEMKQYNMFEARGGESGNMAGAIAAAASQIAAGIMSGIASQKGVKGAKEKPEKEEEEKKLSPMKKAEKAFKKMGA